MAKRMHFLITVDVDGEDAGNGKTIEHYFEDRVREVLEAEHALEPGDVPEPPAVTLTLASVSHHNSEDLDTQ